MVFTEEDKAFIIIFVPDYRLWTTETYETSLTMDVKGLDWITLHVSRSCLKSGCPSTSIIVVNRGLCVVLNNE